MGQIWRFVCLYDKLTLLFGHLAIFGVTSFFSSLVIVFLDWFRIVRPLNRPAVNSDQRSEAQGLGRPIVNF